MAYKELIGASTTNTADAMSQIYTQLEAMGWTKYDYQPYEGSCASVDTPVDTVNETITIVSHSFVNGQHIQYYTAGTVIGGLTSLTRYFIVNVSGNTFKLSTTQGGGAVNLTNQGVGTHYFREGYRIYSSDGEDSKPTQYVEINRSTALNIIPSAWYYWNSTTHAGLGRNTSPAYLPTLESAFYIWVYGNKNFVNIVSKTGSIWAGVLFGWATKFWDIQTTLTAGASSGSNVVISVASTTGFVAGKTYQIFGVAGEGRDSVIVNAIGAGTLTITTLLRNYATGAIIGMTPSTLGQGSWGNSGAQWNITHSTLAVGTGDYSNDNPTPYPMIVGTNVDPDARGEQKYLLQPYLLVNTYPPDNYFFGWTPDYVYFCPVLSMTNEDTVGVTENDSGTASSGTNNTLVDSGKSWTPDAWIGKAVIIKTGTGAGQIRKITDNDGTSITVSPNWTTNLSTDSTYVIVDEAYRFFFNGSYGWALREGIA